ncbi:hypothetical protein VE04_02951 [Pseudogymnoascus sp. 24MN13]|nr:hypothetical protein VE04_02951 [Pseudogymnoascus sp. 24MN13]
MKFLQLLATSALLGLSMANPTPDATLDAEIPADLDKRACTSLSSAKCHGSSGVSGGIYCGYCAAIQGTDWAIGNHRYYAYQINGAATSCCSYGYRDSCEKNAGSALQCPF